MKWKCKCSKPALVVALFIAGMHLLWTLLVALSLGQTYLNWIFPLHLLNNPYTVLPFSLGNALLLTLISFAVSYISTLIFVWLWKAVKIKQ